MPFELYDYVDTHGDNLFRDWTEGLEKAQLAKLNERLDKLAVHGDTLMPDMLTGTHVPGIQKLRVKGNVQLRPMLCKGPVSHNTEYTLLAGATERDGKLTPKDIEQTASNRRSDVENNPEKRRKSHERVTK